MIDPSRVQAVLARGRAAKRVLMRSRVTIRRENGRARDAHDQVVAGWEIVDTGVPFRLGGRSGAGASRTVRLGEREHQIATRIGSLPWDYPHLRDGDCVDITHGQNAGRAFKVVDATPADDQTALRVDVYEIDRPATWT